MKASPYTIYFLPSLPTIAITGLSTFIGANNQKKQLSWPQRTPSWPPHRYYQKGPQLPLAGLSTFHRHRYYQKAPSWPLHRHYQETQMYMHHLIIKVQVSASHKI